MSNKRKKPTKAEQKKRKMKFQQSQAHRKNVMSSMQQEYNEQMKQRMENIRRASIVNGILEARPEVAKVVDNCLILNDETTYLNEQDNIVYWKADNNPLVSGLDEFDNYPKYSPDFFNQILNIIYQNKLQTQAPVTETDIDLSEFDLILDEPNEESN